MGLRGLKDKLQGREAGEPRKGSFREGRACSGFGLPRRVLGAETWGPRRGGSSAVQLRHSRCDGNPLRSSQKRVAPPALFQKGNWRAGTEARPSIDTGFFGSEEKVSRPLDLLGQRCVSQGAESTSARGPSLEGLRTSRRGIWMLWFHQVKTALRFHTAAHSTPVLHATQHGLTAQL